MSAPSLQYNRLLRSTHLPAVVLVTALCLTLLATSFYASNARLKEGRQFERLAADARDHIEGRLRAYIAILQSGAALFAVHPNTTRADWRVFVERLRLAEFYPGAQGLGFTVRLRPEQIDPTVAAMRQQGLTAFQVHPPASRPEYHAIIYLEPMDLRNQAALGFDMYTEPLRRAAMDRAWTNAAPAASGKVRLVQEISGPAQAGFLIYVPVFQRGEVPPTIAERKDNLRGFVYSPFRADDLFNGIFGKTNPLRLGLDVYAGSGTAETNLLYHSRPLDTRHPAYFQRLRVQSEIRVAGMPWTLVFFSPAESFASVWGVTSLMGLTGLVVSLALYHLARREVSARAAMEEAANRLGVTLSSIGDAVIATDHHGRIDFMNPPAQQLTGWTLAEARGRDLLEVTHLFHEATLQPVENPVSKVLREGRVVRIPNQTMLRSRAGMERAIEDSGAPILDLGGKMLGVILVFHDVTDQRQDARRLRLQHDVARLLAEAPCLESALPGILKAFCENLGWDLGEFWRIDRNSQTLLAADLWCRPGLDCAAFVQESRSMQFTPGVGLPGRVLQSPAEVYVREIAEDINFPRRASALQVGLHSAVAIPVLQGEKVLGVMEFFSRTPKIEQELYIDTAAAIASQISQFMNRKAAEASLRESEERHRMISTTAPEGIITINQQTIIQSMNPAAETIFGYKAEELVGQPITLLMPERQRKPFQADLRRLLEPANRALPWSGTELLGLRKDGGEIPLEVSFGLAHFEGQLLFTGFLRDISERKLASAALERHNIRLKLLADFAGRLLLASNPEALVAELFQQVAGHLQMEAFFNYMLDEKDNRLRLAAIAGISSDALPSLEQLEPGEGVCGLVALDKKGLIIGNIQQSNDPRLQTLKNLGIRAYACHPLLIGERVIGTLSFATRQRDAFPPEDIEFIRTLAHYVAIARERIRLTQSLEQRVRELAKSEERFRAIVESAHDHAIFTLSMDGKVTSWNTGAHLIFGFQDKEILGRQHEVLFTPEDRLANYPEEEMRRAFVSGYASNERWHLRKDGTRFFGSGSMVPLQDEKNEAHGFLKIIRDRTEERQAQEALRESQAALESAQAELEQYASSLESKVADRTARLSEMVGELEAFSYSISHDLRAPLRAMNAYAGVLMEDFGTKLGEEGLGYLKKIIAASARMDRLITDVLAYTRVSRSELGLAPVRLDSLLSEIIEHYPALQAADVEISQPLLEVLAEPSALTQCLSNLLTNATKFVPAGTRPHIRIWTEKRDKRVRIWIEDNGIGIDPSDHERIFGVFQRLHSNAHYEGTGIGLAIVKKSVERMNGQVGLQSELGKGTRFWIELQRP